jgi:hypothetical protein
MESAVLGLVLDSSGVIAAERKKQSIPDFIEIHSCGAWCAGCLPITCNCG